MSFLGENLAFYASYHSEVRNQMIHFICIWPIFFTAQIFLFYAPTPAFLGPWNWCAIISLLYGLFYFFVELPGIAGPISAFFVLFGYVNNKLLYESDPNIWKVALIIHVIGWIAQIAAHQFFEKRAPAFLDNLLQALVMAPLFVVIEILFILGYKRDLEKQVLNAAAKNISEFRKQKKA
jgi:2-hydroxy fatty acid dioxygenase